MRQLDIKRIDLILSRGRRRGAPRLRTVLAPWRSTGAHRNGDFDSGELGEEAGVVAYQAGYAGV